MDTLLTIAFIVVVVVLVVNGISIYNHLSSLQEAVRSADETFNTSLLRKQALSKEVVDLAERVAIHERATHEACASAMTQAARELANSLRPTAIFANLALQFPTLRHETGFLSAQQSAASIETQIDSALTARNKLVEAYNSAVRAFPAIVIATIFGFDVVKYRRDADNTHTGGNLASEEERREQATKLKELESKLSEVLKHR